MKKAKVELEQICYVSLGSNMGDSIALLEAAVEYMGRIGGVKLKAVSAVYRTEPQGDKEQPWFFNRVAKIICGIPPHKLLAELQRIENELGRVRGERRFGPRSMDIDILLYGNTIIDEPDLAVPHPRMTERAFVLAPLLEIEPELALPGGASVREALSRLDFTLTGDKIYQNL